MNAPRLTRCSNRKVSTMKHRIPTLPCHRRPRQLPYTRANLAKAEGIPRAKRRFISRDDSRAKYRVQRRNIADTVMNNVIRLAAAFPLGHVCVRMYNASLLTTGHFYRPPCELVLRAQLKETRVEKGITGDIMVIVGSAPSGCSLFFASPCISWAHLRGIPFFRRKTAV